jgi:protein O-mannosyl-transferase
MSTLAFASRYVRYTATSVTAFASSGQRSAAMLLVISLTVVWFAYAPGLSGSLHFDDPHNLGGLARIVDSDTAVLFISEGTAGPLGRPLALASFALQGYAWPDATGVFLRTNVLLHLINGSLVAWMLYLLALARRLGYRQAAWIACLSATIWMLLPLLASSSLLIVQRMATLSATFVFLGAVGYLYGRTVLERRPRVALLTMTLSLVVGTTLAALAKENGLLLPLLVGVTEATLLPATRLASPQLRTLWRIWAGAFFLFPAIAIVGYLTIRLSYSDSVRLVRDFSGSERLLTQAHVLWQYLYHALLPATSNLGPFQDDQIVYRNWFRPLSVLAVSAWILVATAAVAFRRRFPLLSFAVSWYLVAHALESTTIPLELYFEHRNYVPLVGPVFATVTAALTAGRKWRPLAQATLLAYVLLLAIVLHGTTSLWGRPALAAEIWVNHNPESKRATQYLAQQLERVGDPYTARRVLQYYFANNPNSVSVALQILALSCVLEPDKDHLQLLETVRSSLSIARFEHGAFETLHGLYQMAKHKRCNGVDRYTVFELASMMAANPRFQASAVVHHNLHVLMSEEAFAQRDLNLTMEHLEQALAARYTLTTLVFAIETLTSAGLYSIAQQFLTDAHEHKPRQPLQASAWRRQVAALEVAMSEARPL